MTRTSSPRASSRSAKCDPTNPAPPVISVELPTGEAYAVFRQKLATNPQDHPARLELARALNQNNELGASLGQYQTLINAEVLLGDVENDLKALAQANPTVSQAWRVLGDAIMRQGRLQDALDTYRVALEQL